MVKSIAGLPCRHLQGLEDASIHEDSKSGHTVARIVPFKLKCAKHMVIKESIQCHDYDEDVFHVFKIEESMMVNDGREYLS